MVEGSAHWQSRSLAFVFVILSLPPLFSSFLVSLPRLAMSWCVFRGFGCGLPLVFCSLLADCVSWLCFLRLAEVVLVVESGKLRWSVVALRVPAFGIDLGLLDVGLLLVDPVVGSEHLGRSEGSFVGSWLAFAAR